MIKSLCDLQVKLDDSATWLDNDLRLVNIYFISLISPWRIILLMSRKYRVNLVKHIVDYRSFPKSPANVTCYVELDLRISVTLFRLAVVRRLANRINSSGEVRPLLFFVPHTVVVCFMRGLPMVASCLRRSVSLSMILLHQHWISKFSDTARDKEMPCMYIFSSILTKGEGRQRNTDKK